MELWGDKASQTPRRLVQLRPGPVCVSWWAGSGVGTKQQGKAVSWRGWAGQLQWAATVRGLPGPAHLT